MRGRTRTEEVPAVVTIATGALGPVIAKLADLLGSKYRVRRKTGKDINFIKSKFKSMHSLFWNIWESEDFDAASKELKKEALDLADDVDDAIDDFILSMEGSRGKLGRYIQIQTKTNESPFEDFKRRVNDVWGKCRIKWRRVNDVWEKISREESMVRQKTAQPFCGLFPRKDIISSPTKPTHRAPFVRKNASKVGDMETATVELISYLVGGENTIVQPQLRMATIVGPAGMGKTTLANMVYEEIEDQFQSRAFVSISPSPNMKEVLTSILQQVAADTTVPFATTKAATEEERLIHQISNFLKNRRYLVVIDDVWHCKEWETIRKCLPENNLTSRIVTTTRINALANKWRVDFQALLYHINTRVVCSELGRKCPTTDRWRYRIGSENLNYQGVNVLKTDMVPEGFDWKHEVVYMCASMPLALVCMFSAVAMVLEEQEHQGLSRETSDVQDMIKKRITQNGIQNTRGFEPLVESLQLGYNDLPHHMLKTCLLYCSIYPRCKVIERDDLVMQWIAENFVDTEEAGNNYLDELVSRGLIQPVDDIPQNTAVEYTLHPMMRIFLRWKLREDTFITCSSHIPSSFARGSRTHRLSIDDFQEDDEDAVEGMDPLFGLDWSHVRSLVVFGCAGRVPLEKLERLRVLHLQNKLDVQDHHLKDICRMLRLRHLAGLGGREISEISPEIATLQYLETLDVWGTWITELPREIGDLQNLKTLRIRGTLITELPREIIVRLKKLKTLDITSTEIAELPKEIGELQQLKTLVVSGTEIAELPKEIGGLQHLTTLNVSRTKITELPKEIWKLHHLENLNLHRTGIAELPSEIGNLENLETLDLSWTEVTKIPREIWGLKKLKILESKTSSLPWEAGQLSKLVGLPDCVRQAWEKSDLVVELAGEILNFTKVIGGGGLFIGTKHMHIPWWIKEHFNNIRELDIRICKLEEEDLRILREMPNLINLTLRFEVVPRTPIAISSDGFARLKYLTVDSGVPRVTFQEGAMPMLVWLIFEFRLYGGPPNTDPIGIKHLTSLIHVGFKCNNEWYRAQDRSCSCISATIDIVREEAREHRNRINLFVTGRQLEQYPANDIAESSKDNNEAWRSGPIEIDELSSIGTAEIDELSSIGMAEIDELSSIGTAEMDEEILHKFGHLVEH